MTAIGLALPLGEILARAESPLCSPLGSPLLQTRKQSPSGRPNLEAGGRLGRYEIVNVLGSGAYGKVLKGYDARHNRYVAIKHMEKTRQNYVSVVKETHYTFKLGCHPYCATFVDKMESADCIYLVLKFAPKGDLYDRVFPQNYKANGLPGKLPEEQALRMFTKICLGLEHIHSKNVVHNDLKLENILLDANDNPIIADMGLSRSFSLLDRTNFTPGTRHYSAPETILGQSVIGTEIDIWALGVMLFIMVYGRYPFFGRRPEDIFSSICCGQPKHDSSVSFGTRALITSMLVKQPRQRATLREILDSAILAPLAAEYRQEVAQTQFGTHELEPFSRQDLVMEMYCPGQRRRSSAGKHLTDKELSKLKLITTQSSPRVTSGN